MHMVVLYRKPHTKASSEKYIWEILKALMKNALVMERKAVKNVLDKMSPNV